MFDSSDADTPLTVTLGKGQILIGMDAAIRGMCSGEKSTIFIQSKWAYDRYPNKPFPQGTTMRYQIEVVSVKKAGTNLMGMYLIIAIVAAAALLLYTVQRMTSARGRKDAEKREKKEG